MNVREAVTAAKRYVTELFEGEQLSNLGLEETVYDGDAGLRKMTVGFSRPWNTPRLRSLEVLEGLGAVSPLKRARKVVSVSDDGRVMSMTDRARVGADE